MASTAFPRVFSPALTLPAPGRRTTADAVAGISAGCAAAEIVHSVKAAGRLTVFVCADASDMIRLADELSWFDPTLTVSVLPDWETLPYDTMSPHEDLVSERLETLWKLAMHARCKEAQTETKSHVDVILTSAATAAQSISAWCSETSIPRETV